MNIEDVKQWTDARLNIQLSKLLGHTEKDAKQVYYGNIRKYTEDIAKAREAQAKAMAFDADLYIAYLAEIVNLGKSKKRFNAMDVGLLLLATPRQISEASYLTLQEVQG